MIFHGCGYIFLKFENFSGGIMADEKETKVKVNALSEFRKRLRNKDDFKTALTDGLKSTNAKVRALAAKTAFKLKDHGFVKQNVLGLIKGDKSKKVLRSISGKITRRELYKKVRASRVMKKVGSKPTEEAAPAAAAPTK
jgi:hypothetical protein